ncbi:MAG: 4'-phosphopantetheinyl transferase superfamily protein [Gemmatimonadaceae bacterium]|nr:4'-phosphopantetheinyl transferase superfamily protein [Gloeobacterales cyanobacterium ES-bin-141]
MLDVVETRVAALWALLSPDEQARAERFYSERHQTRFIVCRGALRELLGQYLGCSACELGFEYGLHGKPGLNARQNPADLRFNLSHSEGLAVIALTGCRDIGVDVEQVRPINGMAIAGRYFSDAEIRQLRQLPLQWHQEAFFSCWTAKEAYIKARGDGLSFALKDFDVSTDPRQAPRMLKIQGSSAAANHWVLHRMLPQPGFIATLALEAPLGKVLSGVWTSANS